MTPGIRRSFIAIVLVIGLFILGGVVRLFSPDTTALIAILAGILYAVLSLPVSPNTAK